MNVDVYILVACPHVSPLGSAEFQRNADVDNIVLSKPTNTVIPNPVVNT
jgi:hypothetical protein